MSTQLFRSIIVGSDGSDTARQAVERAADLATQSGAKLLVLGAAGGAGAASELEAVLGGQAAELVERGLDATSSVRIGDAEDVLVDVAAEIDADLIVVGNRGMTGAKRFILGSVPDKVSHKAHCSVLIASTT